MSGPEWVLGDYAEAWRAARDLAAWIDENDSLPVLAGDTMEDPDEQLHASITAHGSWYGAVEVFYEHREFADFSSLPLLALSLGATGLGNKRTREAAAALAAPQWRRLTGGDVQVWLTSKRVGVTLDNEYWSFWIADGFHLGGDMARWRLEFQSGRLNWFAIEGPWVPFLAVALTHATSGEVLLLDSEPPAPPGWFSQPHGRAAALTA